MKLRIQVDGRAYEVEVDVLSESPGHANGRPAALPIPESVLRARPPQKLAEDSSCRSPIAGRVTAVLGAIGSKVGRHQPVVLIEAMKMEIPIGPAVDGTVKEIHVQPGDPVIKGQVLFDLA